MIVSINSTTDIENSTLMNMIENSIEDGKCIEIYMKQGDMLYIKKNDDRDYTYGYYFRSSDNEEWKCNKVTTYSYDMTIEFEYNDLYKECRTFDISDCNKLYVADEWSN